MKKKILWSDFLNPENRIAINCETEAEAKEFLYMLDARGVEWYGGGTLDETFFGEYGEAMCYAYHSNGLRYCSYKHWFANGYTVYRYSDVEFVDDKEDESAKNNKDSDLRKSVLMVLDQLKDLQEEAEKKQDEYKDSFVQWAVFQEQASAYKTAVMLLERAIKA